MKIPITKDKASLIEEMVEWAKGIYSIRFKGYEDTIWCKSISDIYLAIEQFSKNGFVKTNEASEVII